MPNKFQNTQDFGGVDISKLPDKIGDTSASDCNGIDFSLERTIKTTGCGPSIGAIDTETIERDGVGDMYVFKKAFGTDKEVLIRNVYTSDNGRRLQWFNQDLTLGNYGRWEDLYNDDFGSDARLGFAPVNGDNGEKINRLIIGTGFRNLVWNGATAQVTNWGANQIITNRSNLLSEGFEVHPNKASEIMVNGKLYTYTGISGGAFTGVTPDPDVTSPTLKDGITQNANIYLMWESVVTRTDLSSTSNTIVRLSGSWSVDEFYIGQKIFVSGFTDALNNGIFTIYNISVDGKTLTTEESTRTVESAGDTVTVSAGAPGGKILLSSQGKLWLSGVIGLESKVYYSVTGIATCFAITSGLGSGGSFDLVEGGGYITALNAIGQNKLVIHKRDSCTIYTRTTDSSANVIESFDIASTGVGIGAAGQNAITSYGKTTYYLSSGGEIRTIEQSIYSTETFSFGSISENVKNMLNIITPNNPYLVYDSKKNRLVLSTNSIIQTSYSSSEYVNMLIYIYISRGANGYEYKASFDTLNSVGSSLSIDIPLVVTTQTTPSGLMLFVPYTRNVYLWGSDIISYDIQKNPYHVSKEFTFGEPAQDKVFDIMNIDGYLYGNTIIKFTVLYGVGGKDGTKSYYINKNSDCVTDVITYNNNYNLLGRNSIVNNYNQLGIGNSYYFKMPLHIDVNRSDRYQIRIETHNTSVVNTFWAINNISTNATLKDVNMNNLLNQNEVSLDGIGVMAIGTTNIVA